MIRVTVWNEYRHEKESDQVRAVYPEGIHSAIARGIKAADLEIRTATLDEPALALAFDPQTSGGLLFGVPDISVARVLHAFADAEVHVFEIGEVREAEPAATQTVVLNVVERALYRGVLVGTPGVDEPHVELALLPVGLEARGQLDLLR